MPSTSVGNTAYYDVVKIHHNKRWLRQKRLLILTSTHVMKCHPAQEPFPSDPFTLSPTKVHLLSTIEYVALKSQRSFILKFRGDHAYFYKSQDALDVVHRVQVRSAALRAAKIMQFNGADVLKAVDAGEVHLPYEEDVRALLPMVIDIKRAVHANAFDGANEVFVLQRRVQAAVPAASNSELSLSGSLRTSITVLRERFVNQILTGRRTLFSRIASTLRDRALPRSDNDSNVILATEVALQQLVVSHVFGTVWADISQSFVAEQQKFDDNCAILAERPMEFFGIHPHFHVVKFDLVREHLRSLQRCRNATDMLNTIYNAVKSVVACVEVHHATARKAAAAAVEAAEQVLLGMSSPRLSDSIPGDASQRVAFSTTVSPTGAEIDENGEGDVAAVAAATAELASTQRTLNRLPERMDYTTDDVLPIFIHLLAWCQLPGIVYYRRFVDFVGDSNESTERAYFFTVFASAVEFILTLAPDDSPSNAPSSCDSVHSPFAHRRRLSE